MTPNIADIIRHHVSLEVRCIDRLYLHAYMPKLQTSGGLCYSSTTTWDIPCLRRRCSSRDTMASSPP